jgi:Predicted Zn peptidase
MKIPNLPRWKRSVEMAQRFIFDIGVCCLPVDLFSLYEKSGWVILTYAQTQTIYPQFSADKIMKQKTDAKTFCLEDGSYITIYNENLHPKRIRWTLGHEIGHIILGHLKFEKTYANIGLSGEEREVLEDEANIFCAELLAPFCILKELKATSIEKIREIADLSWVAAKNRQKSLKYHWNDDLYAALEKRFKFQFADFLAGNQVKDLQPWKEKINAHIEQCAETPCAYDLDDI